MSVYVKTLTLKDNLGRLLVPSSPESEMPLCYWTGQIEPRQSCQQKPGRLLLHLDAQFSHFTFHLLVSWISCLYKQRKLLQRSPFRVEGGADLC